MGLFFGYPKPSDQYCILGFLFRRDLSIRLARGMHFILNNRPCSDALHLVVEMLGHLGLFWEAVCISRYIVPRPYASGILR